MNFDELQQLRVLWERNIFPEQIRATDGLVYSIENITLPPNDHLEYFKKVSYRSGKKKIVLDWDSLREVDKVYSFYEVVEING